MHKPSLKAYLDLIQQLLSCPQGEEWILLRQSGELVNLGLVEVMEQVANHFTMEGKTKAAKYLHNWAGKLHHILIDNNSVTPNSQDRYNAYLKLIQALLDCPEGLEAQILKTHQDLIDPELIKLINQAADQVADQEPDTAEYLQTIAADLKLNWLKHHEFQPTFKQEIAPDPWLDEAEQVSEQSPAKMPNLATQSEQSREELADTSQSSSSVTTESASLQELLMQIAASLNRLEHTLATQKQVINPLWYMEVLEKAHAAEWILTTDEVEHLIGVKPHCHHDETVYERGNWAFIKVGKIGLQTGWQVKKRNDR